MSIKVICDCCHDDTGELDDSAWRTVEIDLAYLPNSREFGTNDSLGQLVLCWSCSELTKDIDVIEIVKRVIAGHNLALLRAKNEGELG
jgi:hypothetical protein